MENPRQGDVVTLKHGIKDERMYDGMTFQSPMRFYTKRQIKLVDPDDGLVMVDGMGFWYSPCMLDKAEEGTGV